MNPTVHESVPRPSGSGSFKSRSCKTSYSGLGKKAHQVRALSMVEMVISMVIVSVMLVAALNTVGASKLGQSNTQDLQKANLLAHALIAEIQSQHYADPSSIPKLKLKILGANQTVSEPLGPESGETASGYRDAFDDVDDYNGLNESPPREKNGTAIPGLTGWRRTVTVAYVKNTDPSVVKADDEGAKRITVQVLRNEIPVTDFVALSTLGPPATEFCCFPDGSGTTMLVAQCTSLGGTPQGAGSNALNASCANELRPVAHWMFDENTGATTTDSESGFVATLMNGVTWETGELNNALGFDGTDDYAEAAHNAMLSLTTQFTITVWIYKYSISGFDNIIVKGNSALVQTNYHLRTNSNQISFGFANLLPTYITTTTANLTRRAWYHIAGTYDSTTGTLAIYVDGVLSRSGVVIGAPAANADPIRLGKTNLGDYFDGRIDDLRIYDTVLTADQIAKVMIGEDP